MSALHHRLFVPTNRTHPTAGAPLLVALHGCTQTAADFAAGTRFDQVAERAGALVLYPEQSPKANPQRCWNWFLEENQTREGPEPAAVLALVEEVARRYPVDPARIYVAGLSAGAAFAAILAEQAPDVFAAVGLMAGVALHASSDLASAYRAMQTATEDDELQLGRNGQTNERNYAHLRATIWAGIDDHYVVPKNSSTLARQFLELLGLDRTPPVEEVTADSVVRRWHDESGIVRVELHRVASLGHAWSGGSLKGSHTSPSGPRASDAMMNFFLSAE